MFSFIEKIRIWFIRKIGKETIERNQIRIRYVSDAVSFELMASVFLFFIGFFWFFENDFYVFFIAAVLGGIWGFKIEQVYRDLRYIDREKICLKYWLHHDILDGAGRELRLKLTLILEIINSIFIVYLFFLIFIRS